MPPADAAPEVRGYPRLTAYLAGLPDGVRSHPQCQVKGSVLRGLIATSPVRLDPADLPRELAERLADPPLPNQWMSEVELNALGLAYQDRIAPERYAAWAHDRNARLFQTSLYKILFLVVSPERLFVGLPLRWSAFRRGSEIRLARVTGHRAELELSYPPGLHNAETLFNMTCALVAAAEAAGAKRSKSELLRCERTSARVSIGWD
jgi:hypothetical protein